MNKTIKVGLGIAGLVLLPGCGQVLGVQHMDLWGAKFDFNSGFEVKAGAQQYDHSLERKGINVEAKDSRKIEKY